METNVSIDYIRKTFDKLGIGIIQKVAEIPLYSDPNYKRIMVYVSWNQNSPRSNYILSRFNEGKNVKLVHDGPWYWKMVLGRNTY